MGNGGVAIVLAGILLVSATPGLAAPLPSRAVTGIQAEADLQALEAFLETKIVQETLAGLGLSPEEVRDASSASARPSATSSRASWSASGPAAAPRPPCSS